MPGFVLPDHTRSGSRRWDDPSVRDLVHRLHYGDATLGWEGDDRLGLFESEGGGWELWRFDEQGGDSIVCRGTAGNPAMLISALVAHDTRKRSADAILEGLAREENAREAEFEATVEQAVDDFMTAATVHKGPAPARFN